jgi:hypothetical protein
MVFVDMHSIISHVDTIQIVQKIRHQDHFVEYSVFQKLKKHNDYPDQPFKNEKIFILKIHSNYFIFWNSY